jgi:hypothetical protein
MRRIVLIVVLALVALGALLLPRCGDRQQQIAPQAALEHRLLDVRDVMVYAEGRAATFRVRTARDVLPGDLSAAMTPAMVDWTHSDLQPGGALLLGNISHGGNPLAGVTLLRTARVRPEAITKAQWVTVPLGGPDAIVHGQLRFVFEPGGIELLDQDPDTVGEPDTITDLVFSWEAWRPPGVEYDIRTGLDPAAYELSLRCYAGPQRFLEDILAGRPWTAYDLQLPGGRAGLAELFRVTVITGDGAARQVLGRAFNRAEEAWREANPDPAAEDRSLVEAWQRLQRAIESGRDDPVADERLELSDAQTRYQSLLRSCATMALYNIDVAVSRLLEQGVEAPGMRPTGKLELFTDPAWMTELADAGWGRILLSAPRALGFLRENPWIVPGNVTGLLDDAGLLVHEDGRRRETHYSLETTTPWGHRDQLLIR